MGVDRDPQCRLVVRPFSSHIPKLPQPVPDRPSSTRFLVIVLVAMALGAVIGASLVLRFRLEPKVVATPAEQAAPAEPKEATVIYSAVDFNELAGWSQDSVQQALPAIRRSCAVLVTKSDAYIGAGPIARRPAAWVTACAALEQVRDGDADLRNTLMQNFTPYRVALSRTDSTEPDDTGLFTGYYEAELHGAPVRGGNYQIPIYAVPRNLVNVNLKDFINDLPAALPGSLVGRVDSNQMKPYYTREEIDGLNVIAEQADVLAWANDPVAVNILHIQGSGRVLMPDGQTLRLGFAGSNGRMFRPLSAILRQANVLPQGTPMSMITIRDWLHQHADQAGDLMNKNTRYIFFRKLDLASTEDGPIGAQGVSLTAGRSLAVDPRFIPLGIPLWLDTTDPDGAPIQRLMVAQDVGSAIIGPVRGDIFWGHGEDNFQKAGRMRHQGKYFLFIPRPPAQPPA